jgi:predicted deacylase
MAYKKIKRLPVRDAHNDHETFIPVGIVEGKEPGPTLAVMGGVHGSEYAAHEGTMRFWDSLDPNQISGRLFVVLAADVSAMCGHSHYVNPVDGKNLNRVWPGKPDGTLTEVIAHTLTQEVVNKSDVLIDCHGGEFDESIGAFIITQATGEPGLDERTINLAMALGMPFVEVRDPSAPSTGTCSGTAVRNGRPGITLEAGGQGQQDEFYISTIYNSLQNALKYLGMKAGEPVFWAGKPVRLDHGVILRTTKQGIYRPEVAVWDWVEEGDLFARVLDFDGRTVLEEILVPETGTVLDVIVARAINADAFAGKIGVL